MHNRDEIDELRAEQDRDEINAENERARRGFERRIAWCQDCHGSFGQHVGNCPNRGGC